MTAAPTSFLERLREGAKQRFSEVGYPTTHDEDWRFTSVAPIARATFVPVSGTGLLASPVPGVQIDKLSESAQIEAHLARYANYQTNAFVALNTANFQDGLLIRIAKGAVIEQPIHLLFESSANGKPTVSNPRTLILAGADSHATIVETYRGSGGAYFTNAVTELVAGDNAVIDHYKLQTEGEKAFHVATLQMRDASERMSEALWGQG